MSTPLAHVFNMSLQEGIVPLEWKEATIRDHMMDFLIKHKINKPFSALVPKSKIMPNKFVMFFSGNN